jgi:insulysin
MLFLGTDKYPSENEYSKFISAHGGMSNAFTSTDHTNYHFDIAPAHLHVRTFQFSFLVSCSSRFISGSARPLRSILFVSAVY